MLVAEYRVNILNPETDVVHSATLRNESSDFLLGRSRGTRPGVLDTSMFPDLRIGVGQPQCTSQYGERRAALTLSTPTGTCTAPDTSDATCTLWENPFAVRIFDSYERSQAPSPVVTFSIAAADDEVVPGPGA